MAIFLIHPMNTITVGGLKAEINGIDSGSSDFICGRIFGPSRTWNVSWDINGICRDNSPECNLSHETNEFYDMRDIAEKLNIQTR